jgi:tryptophan synthase beta chain
MRMQPIKIPLNEGRIPADWRNAGAEMPGWPAPPLAHYGKPLDPRTLSPIFPAHIIEEKISHSRWIRFANPSAIYHLSEPTILYRAIRLERALGTTAPDLWQIRGLSPAGSHTPNLPQPTSTGSPGCGIFLVKPCWSMEHPMLKQGSSL